MTSKQRTWGQYATPADVADLLLGFCLRRPEDRVLDPSCGDGALLRRAARWQAWLASSTDELPQTLYGVELDVESAEAIDLPAVNIRRANFFTIDPGEYAPFDAIIGNPPYTRAEWIGRLDAAAEAQLPLFADDALEKSPVDRGPLLTREFRASLSRRAGLYAYFFLHSMSFLREGGRLGFVVPNGWLDVAYGQALKQFLLDHFRILAVIESAVERWFAGAGVNTCLIILERSGDPATRAANRVRFAGLQRPLPELLDSDAEDSGRVGAVEQFVGRLLPPDDRRTASLSVRVYEQIRLDPSARWGAFWRAPEVMLRRPPRPLVALHQWAEVQRGFTTGANHFFYLNPEQIDRWSIEPEFRRPLLKSLRGVDQLRPDRSAADYEWLAIPSDARLADTHAGEYVEWGMAQGIHLRRTCAARRPWYSLPEQPAAALLMAKGIWQRHFVALPQEPMAVDQQVYRLMPGHGVDAEVAAALLNSAWFALQCELHGRLNLGEGVLWLAAYELSEVELPDPRAIDPATAARLVQSFRQLAERPVAETVADLNRLDRWGLDELVFDLIGLSPPDREAVRQALLDCLTSRRQRAQARPVDTN
jgi:methylase of polypeptide subunit release factors